MITPAQRLTYERLRFFFEAYDLPHCRAELDRAWRRMETDSRPAFVARRGGRGKGKGAALELHKKDSAVH